MATFLQTSGAISMSQINAVFGRGTNLNAYRGTTYYTASGGPFTFPSTPISFNNFYGTGPSSNAPVVDIDALTGQTYIAGYQEIFPVTASIAFFTDGTYYIDREPNDPVTGNWATPTTTGIGSSYWISWVRVGVIGSNGTSTATSGRVQMNSIRVIACNKNPGGSTTYTAEYDISIWDSPEGGTQVGSALGFTLIASRI